MVHSVSKYIVIAYRPNREVWYNGVLERTPGSDFDVEGCNTEISVLNFVLHYAKFDYDAKELGEHEPTEITIYENGFPVDVGTFTDRSDYRAIMSAHVAQREEERRNRDSVLDATQRAIKESQLQMYQEQVKTLKQELGIT